MKIFPHQRATQRFDLKAPAIIKQSTAENGQQHHLLLTRDLSSKGAYFITMYPVSYDGQVEIELLLQVTNDNNLTHYVHVLTCGEVIRHDEQGLAVRFDDDVKLMPFT